MQGSVPWLRVQGIEFDSLSYTTSIGQRYRNRVGLRTSRFKGRGSRFTVFGLWGWGLGVGGMLVRVCAIFACVCVCVCVCVCACVGVGVCGCVEET